MKKTNTLKCILFLLSAAAFLMIATRSSFLYVCNNWDDANSYFSMGKALFNGKVLYRDVLDQKGMYLYFLYGLAYLISNKSFLGVYFLEVILGFLDILGFYKILKLYIKETFSLVFAPLCFAVIVVSNSFWWGGAAEEICLPLYIWGLYIILDYFKREYETTTMSYKKVFVGGVLAGVVANIKFTGLGFFFAWMMMVFFAFLLHKKFLDSLKACVVFLVGMFIPFIPWIIYFGINKSLYYWYFGYVYINVFLYPNVDKISIFAKIYNLAKLMYFIILDNLYYFIFVIAGLIYVLFIKKQKLITRLIVPILFGFLFLGIFIGGRKLPYYSLPLSVFGVFGFAFLGDVIDIKIDRIREIIHKGDDSKAVNSNKVSVCISYVVLTVLSLVFIFNTSMNVQFMKETKDSYFMFRFRDEIIEDKETSQKEVTLLNVGCLDCGLYTLTGIVPSCRWFQTQTLDVPEPENNPYLEQDRYIREGLVDYVVARENYPNEIFDKYELVDQADYSFSGYDFTYYLFKLK